MNLFWFITDLRAEEEEWHKDGESRGGNKEGNDPNKKLKDDPEGTKVASKMPAKPRPQKKVVFKLSASI